MGYWFVGINILLAKLALVPITSYCFWPEIFSVIYSGSRVQWDWEICVILVHLGVFTIVINLQTAAIHGSTPYLLVHYYKPEIVIFECPRYSWIKEENYWKFWVLQIGKFHLLSGIIQTLFPLGLRDRNSAAKTALKNPCWEFFL